MTKGNFSILSILAGIYCCFWWRCKRNIYPFDFISYSLLL